MTVLHLIDSEGLYGAEVVLLHLIAEQKRQGIKPILGSIGKPDIPEKDIETAASQRAIDIKTFRMKNGPNLLGAISIAQYAKQQHVDLIHCHGYKADILMGILPACLRKIPYLITIHGWNATKRFSRMWLYCWADAIFAKRAGKMIVVSESMLSHPQVLAVGLKPAVVHNGIPPISSSPKRKKLPDNSLSNFCNNKNFIIGTIGRLSPEKCFDILINAVANTIENGRNISLVIMGEGRERKKLEHLACSRNIADKVLFTGYVDQASRYFDYFNVFVLSSSTEGLPITLLEAMQANVAVIATRVGGIPEVLDNDSCGISVEPMDVSALTQAITRLYDSPELQDKLRVAARKRVKKEFSSKSMEHGYRKLYEKLIFNGIKMA